MNSPERRTAYLLSRHFTGDLDPAEWAEFEQSLEQSEQLREHYWDNAFLSTDLHYAMRAERCAAELSQLAPAMQETSVGGSSLHWRVFLAASLLIAIAGALLLTGSSPAITDLAAEVPVRPVAAKLGSPVATLYFASECQWSSVEDVQLVNGANLREGQVCHLKQGLAELAYNSGVRLIIEGPAEFELFSHDQLRLESGRLTAQVPENATGFQVNTATTKVVDLGTEFGVAAEPGGPANVEVFSGQVLLASQSNRSTPQLVIAGQAVRADERNQQLEVQPTAAHASWIRDIQRPRRSAHGDIVANFGEDFSRSTPDAPAPATGWRYLWNPTDLVGNPEAYSDMLWSTRGVYAPNGSLAIPAPLPARSLQLSSFGGHPGPDLAVCVDGIQRGPIVAYSVPMSGDYMIEEGWCTRVADARRDGYDNAIDLVIHDQAGRELLTKTVDAASTVSFELELGAMEAGETVYLAVLPKHSSRYDNFQWDFSIVRRTPAGQRGGRSE